MWIGLLLTAFLAGCAGIEPYEPHDYRREGPKQGLFSGSKGEFVIYRTTDEWKTGSEADSKLDETTNGEQQKMDNGEKKEKVKSGKQQP